MDARGDTLLSLARSQRRRVQKDEAHDARNRCVRMQARSEQKHAGFSKYPNFASPAPQPPRGTKHLQLAAKAARVHQAAARELELAQRHRGNST